MLIAVLGFMINILLFPIFKSGRGGSSSGFTPFDDLDTGLIRKDSREPHKIEAKNQASYEDGREN
ncbi:hypothetical protein KIS4809_0605 [Bacillus sp. ZZV12-4809]|nr:hypothetical protein KIS4809_0605 [Bacillus sp. ZZV12-4809]